MNNPIVPRSRRGSTLSPSLFNWSNMAERFFSDDLSLSMPYLSLFDRPFTTEGRVFPRVDVITNDVDIQVIAELPGLDERDINLSVESNRLLLRGEKKVQNEQNEGNHQHHECYYGSFYREIPLACEINTDKATATFKNGLLNITLPKTESAKKSSRNIAIKTIN